MEKQLSSVFYGHKEVKGLPQGHTASWDRAGFGKLVMSLMALSFSSEEVKQFVFVEY